MTRKTWLLIILIIGIGIGCQNSEPIEMQSILGEFYYIEDSKDYTHLDLREDKTFHFNQAKHHSCEIWGHWYGEWEINNNRLTLYEGINLDTLIEINSKRNITSDTLTIIFEDAFIKEFPNLKVRIGFDSLDTEIKNNKITFNKIDYCIKNEIIEDPENVDNEKTFPTSDKKDGYKYYPLELNLRANNYYHKEHYILNKEKIRFKLGKFKRENDEKKKIIQYRKENEILHSTSYVEWINNHKLKRRK